MGKDLPCDMKLETASEDPLDVQLEAIKGEVGKEVLDMFEKFKELQKMLANFYPEPSRHQTSKRNPSNK